MGIGVGTPSRIIDLLDSGTLHVLSSKLIHQIAVSYATVLISVGALSSSGLERVVIDCSHIDQKLRGIFDVRESQGPLMALLNRSELKSRYGNGSGKIRLLLY